MLVFQLKMRRARANTNRYSIETPTKKERNNNNNDNALNTLSTISSIILDTCALCIEQWDTFPFTFSSTSQNCIHILFPMLYSHGIFPFRCREKRKKSRRWSVRKIETAIIERGLLSCSLLNWSDALFASWNFFLLLLLWIKRLMKKKLLTFLTLKRQVMHCIYYTYRNNLYVFFFPLWIVRM